MTGTSDADAFLGAMDDVANYVAMMAGYKAKWLEAGFSETTAEALCLQYGQLVTAHGMAATQIKVAAVQMQVAAAHARR